MGGLAIGLLNFGDRVGKISAGIFTIIGACAETSIAICSPLAMGVMIYALVIYHWRSAAIRKRGSGPYDDRLGPTVLCLAILGRYYAPQGEP